MVLVAGLDHLVALFHGHGQRLFTEDMLACGGAVDDDVAVQVGRGDDDDGVDLAVAEDIMVIRIAFGDAKLCGSCLCGVFHGVDDGHNLGGLDLVLVVACVDHTCSAAADEAGAKKLLFHICNSPCLELMK